MKMKEVKNGDRISDQRVVTYVHKTDYQYPQARKLRIASGSEVSDYLTD